MGNIVLVGKRNTLGNTLGHHNKSGVCNTVSCVMIWYILFSETGSSSPHNESCGRKVERADPSGHQFHIKD